RISTERCASQNRVARSCRELRTISGSRGQHASPGSRRSGALVRTVRTRSMPTHESGTRNSEFAIGDAVQIPTATSPVPVVALRSRPPARSGQSVNPALSTLVASAEHGDHAAADQLFTALYDELHRMARRELAKRGAGVTIGATTLLHEAYLDISDRDRAAFPDRNRFMGYAARVMRGLIIDYARRRQAQKRGGQFEI